MTVKELREALQSFKDYETISVRTAEEDYDGNFTTEFTVRGLRRYWDDVIIDIEAL